MLSYLPVIGILLALIAAGSIVYIAWEITSDDFQDSVDEERRNDDAS